MSRGVQRLRFDSTAARGMTRIIQTRYLRDQCRPIIVRYVNTASTPGGDGTSNITNSSTATRAYASLSEWESNEQTNLVSARSRHVVICDASGGDDTTRVSIAGWTTSDIHRVEIRAAENSYCHGSFTDGYIVSAAHNDGAFDIVAGQHVHIYGLIVNNTQTSGGWPRAISNYSIDTQINDCVFGTTSAGGPAALDWHDDGAAIWRNCIAHGGSGSGGFRAKDESYPTYINCSAVNNSGRGFYQVNNAGPNYPTLINCVGYNNPTADFSYTPGVDAASTNNASSDSTEVGSNPITTDIVAGDFMDAANNDFRVASTGSTLYQAGSNTGADMDIQHHVRRSTPDVGAFEFLLVKERYINTASTPGGDGTTNATTGANRAYAGCIEWEAAENRAIGASELDIVYCDGAGGVDDVGATYFNINGWSMVDHYSLEIRNHPDDHHGGVYGQGYIVERFDSGGGANSYVYANWDSADSYIMQGITFRRSESVADRRIGYLSYCRTIFRDCFFWNESTDDNYSGLCYGRGRAGLQPSYTGLPGGEPARYINCVFKGRVHCGNGHLNEFINCTLTNPHWSTGWVGGFSTRPYWLVTHINCVGFNTASNQVFDTVEYYATVHTTNNASDDTTANNDTYNYLNGIENITSTDFIDSANEDFRLSNTSVLIGAGQPTRWRTADITGKILNNEPTIGAYDNPRATLYEPTLADISYTTATIGCSTDAT